MADNSQSRNLSPTIEQVSGMVLAVEHYLNGLADACLIEGAHPELLPETVEFDRNVLGLLYWELELALHPQREPLAADSSLRVSGWRYPLNLVKSLKSLEDVRKRILSHWGLEATATAESYMLSVMPPERIGKGLYPSLRPGCIRIEKAPDWPPPIPQAWCYQLETAARQLRDAVLEMSAVQSVSVSAETPGQPTNADAGGTAETATTSTARISTLKEPPREAFSVYRYRFATGKNQTELASDPKLMEIIGKTVTQGQISRLLKRVTTWIEAGNVLPSLPKLNEKPRPIDPERLDLGERQDGQTPRQRPQRESDENN
jgi:hypothetical protein